MCGSSDRDGGVDAVFTLRKYLGSLHAVTDESTYSLGSTTGGDEGTRTPDPLRAKQVLFQLSYIPIW